MTHPSVLAIDPGNTDSAYTLIDLATRRPIEHDKIGNPRLLALLPGMVAEHDLRYVGIEMIASYGMPVGREVFETCVWIGRFAQTLEANPHQVVDLVTRQPIKLHHCHTSKAKDSNITQALVDRFATGVSNHGKGTKADPGWFYGFKADIWQAYALAVYIADTFGPITVPAPAAAQGALL